MNVFINVSRGLQFSEGANLSSTLRILTSFEKGLNESLKRAIKVHDSRYVEVEPKIRITEVGVGSLDVNTVIDCALAATPIFPEISAYAWNYFIMAGDLIQIMVEYFRRESTPMSIHVSNSPGATVNVTGEGDIISVPKESYEVAKKIHPNLNDTAELIRGAQAREIRIGATQESRELPEMEFTPSNQNNFKVETRELTSDEPLEIECSIYRLNIKNNTGRLDYYDEDQDKVLNKPFEFSENVESDCKDALGAERSVATLYPVYKVNALGEREVQKLLLDSIRT